ncbi:MAG: MarR family transcriptional regulator [Alphaproteobacteria bacterium]|nr:MarR family transcriptional regulator [Alphaproteobacteria bacterium]TAD91477.1 MAG: MarR family transcriptional regulator [Alphaproteobacteria bacterium]
MTAAKAGHTQLFLREEDLRQAIELLFFAYRDFTAEPDRILDAYGFGRAHHRVIYFVGRHPGMTVSALLAILKITKQSLARVLSQLVAEGYILQRPGQSDRRQRLLELTDKGRDLERLLTDCQKRLIADAYRNAGAQAVEGFRTVMTGLVSAHDRDRFKRPEPK